MRTFMAWSNSDTCRCCGGRPPVPPVAAATSSIGAIRPLLLCRRLPLLLTFDTFTSEDVTTDPFRPVPTPTSKTSSVGGPRADRNFSIVTTNCTPSSLTSLSLIIRDNSKLRVCNSRNISRNKTLCGSFLFARSNTEAPSSFAPDRLLGPRLPRAFSAESRRLPEPNSFADNLIRTYRILITKAWNDLLYPSSRPPQPAVLTF